MNILLSGASGKMGQEVIKYVKDIQDINIFAGYARNSIEDKDIIIYNNIDDIEHDYIDVILDFSRPKQTMKALKYAINYKKPIVICTTGLNTEEMEEIIDASSKIPVLFAKNTSLGINLLDDIVRFLTKSEENWEISMIEKHHNQKIDSPSGTAIMLLNTIMLSNSNYNVVYGNHNEIKEKNDISVHSIRMGNIKGEHTIIFSDGDEIIEVKHSAISRKVFVKGAIRACKYLISNKGPGIYNIKDIYI